MIDHIQNKSLCLQTLCVYFLYIFMCIYKYTYLCMYLKTCMYIYLYLYIIYIIYKLYKYVIYKSNMFSLNIYKCVHILYNL